jgi:uncharacterized membrane protein
MSRRLAVVLAFVATLGSAVSGGVLFAFSTFVMAALARLPAEQGVAAMQAINVTVINPAFMLTFLGTGAAWIGLAALQLSGRPRRLDWVVLAAGGLYVFGCLGVTFARNVPLNDALAALSARDPAVAAFWRYYLGAWTLWNHVRASAAILAAALMLGIRGGGGRGAV